MEGGSAVAVAISDGALEAFCGSADGAAVGLADALHATPKMASSPSVTKMPLAA